MQPEIRGTTGATREQRVSGVHEAPEAGETPRSWREWRRNLMIAATAGVFLALVGAVETGQLPLWDRLLYWVPLALAGAFLGHGVSALVARIPKANSNPWAFGAILAVALSIPVTLTVWLYTEGLFRRDLHLSHLPAFFVPVLVISTAMTALMTLISWPGRVTHAPALGAALPVVRFLERLPPKLKGAVIYAVSSEDHYLRLHTSKGSDLILMRLSDAITELEGLEGAQTHRSWWVARDAVENTRREGDKILLVLKGGAEAPVSRPNVRPLREAGWF